MLKLEKVTKQYLDVLFEDISFLLGDSEKVGLVGLNGCGKTTLLRIISGEENADQGKVEVVNEVIGYLQQEFTFPNDQLVGEFLENLVEDPYTEMYKVKIILSKLSFDDADEFQYIHTLSEGQKMKLKLAELLIKEPTILLLDEPTNHLDIEGILWFESFIKEFPGVCIIISHDREFLNNTVNKIFEIDEKSLNIFEGNYDDYLVGKQKFIEDRARQFSFQERKRERLENLINNARRISNGKKRGKAVKAAKKRLEREVVSNEINEYEEKRVKKFGLDGFVHNSKKVVEVEKLTFGYKKDKEILKDTDFSIYGKGKIWFYGRNGIGKTTFINLLRGKLQPSSGNISWGENITWTYFSQDQSHLDMDATVEDYFLKNTGIPYDKSFGALERFLFSKEFRNNKLKVLSPGQRARLSFCIFSQHKYDFLILDEPTNHLDIQTKEIIEDALSEFDGAILLISHDRYFVSSIGISRTITLTERKLLDTTSTFMI
ncbi:MAG: ABC-F family ATP-binding cassette domain-containing protein [Candidatus Dojkabacteria bacterium]|nr:ABC-F family ATP-binding cassette domain-containing protein [Candidatus Dojkabacteria bacterium]